MIKPTSYSNKPLLFVLLILASVASSAQEPAKNRTTPQQLRVVSFQGDLRALLGSLAETDGVVIGFETAPQLPLLVKVEARDVNLHQLLDVATAGQCGVVLDSSVVEDELPSSFGQYAASAALPSRRRLNDGRAH